MAFYSYLSTKIIIAFITKSYQDLFGVRSYINAITLPADKKGEPDWYYMQNYILSIQERTSHSPILI